ncbi:hypothetical protein Tco_0882740 [Tanacetum coccineum]
MDDPNITIEEYIRLGEERARKQGKVFNWETAKYSKIWYDEDVHDLRSIENEFPAIAFNDSLKSGETLSCEPTVSSLNNDEIDFRISFDESDDEDYTHVKLAYEPTLWDTKWMDLWPPKTVIVDADVGIRRRKLVCFVGGLDLCNGRYDNLKHPIYYHMVCEEHFVLRWPDNFSLDSGAPLLCAGITSYTSLKKFGLGIPDMKVGMVVLVGLVMLLPRWLDLVLNS